MDDTAVIERDTASEVEEAQPEFQPEIATPPLEPETDVQEETPETESAVGDEPTAEGDAPPADPADAEPDDDLLKDPRVTELLEKRLKGELAKKDESFRRQREAEQKQAEEAAQANLFAQQRNQAAQWRQQQAAQTLGQLTQFIAKQVEEGKDLEKEVWPQVWQSFSGMAQFIDRAAVIESLRPAENALAEILQTEFSGYTPTNEAQGGYWSSYAKQDLPGMMKAVAKIAADAAVVRERPKLRKEIEAELKAAAKTNELRETDARRKAQPRPTSVNGTAPPTDEASLRAIIENPETTEAARKEAHRKLYPFLYD